MPGHWYSLSSELNPNWETYFIDQPELRVYWEELWHKHDLVRHTLLNTAVTHAEWDADAQMYHVSVQNVRTGEASVVDAQAVVCALGLFQGAVYPKDVTGIETFKGDLFHSAEWRHDVTLKGKRVGVIGNGCSA